MGTLSPDHNSGSVARALQSIFVSDPIRLMGLSEEHRRCQFSIVAKLEAAGRERKSFGRVGIWTLMTLIFAPLPQNNLKRKNDGFR